MAFGGGGSQDLTIKVRVDESGTVQILNQVGDAVKKVGTESTKTEGYFSKFGDTIQTAGIGFLAAERAASILINTITGIPKALVSAISAGANIEDIFSSFDKAAQKAGTFGDVLTGQLQNAVEGTVSKLDLLSNSNELLQAGMDPTQIVSLTEATRSFADAMGKDTKTALDAVTDSLLRGRDTALKALGVTVDNELAVLRYKEAHKLLGRALTETQTVEANRIAVVEALTQKYRELGTPTKDAGEAIDTISAKLSDFATEVLRAIGGNANLASALNDVATALRNTDFTPIIEAIKSATEFTADFIRGLQRLSTILPLVAQAARAVTGIGVSLSPVTDAIDRFRGTTAQATVVQHDATSALLKNIQVNQKKSQADKELSKERDRLNKLEADGINKTKQGADAAKAAADAAKKYADELKKYPDALQAALSGETKLQAALRQAATDAGNYADKIEELRIAFEAAGGSPTAFAGEVAASMSKVGEVIDVGTVQDSGKSIGKVFGDALSSAAGDALTSLFNGDAIDGKALGQSLGSAIAQGIAESIPGGAAFGPIAGALGGALGSAIGGLFSSKDGPGTAARKQADTFFADLFEANRLSVIINGELVQLKDLVFGSGGTFADGSFDSLFASLPDTARQAFAGVGAAFEELLGVSEDIGGQLAAVFANNLVGGIEDAGNALNNLQLLVEATGKSFEELGGAITEAFLEGKLSAEEAQAAIAGLKATMEKGIPGAVGAVAQAFNNMAAAGNKGGRALLDAIQDVGVEAKELGINDLPALANIMVNTFGLSAQAVAQFFEAARVAGINSVTDLANATQETLLATAANIQVLAAGGTPTATPIPLSTATGGGGGGFSAPSGGGGGGNSAADKAKAAAKARADAAKQAQAELEKLVTGSDDYKNVIISLNAGLLDGAQAQSLITGLYGKGEAAIKSLNAWQKQYNQELKKNKTVSAETAQALDQAKKAVEQFGDALGGDKTAKVNGELLDFITKFKGQTDLLGLAAVAAGGSFKLLQQNALDAFLSGATTFQEARAALEDAGQGIAGKRGASGDAFRNLLDFGTKGGRLAVDALRDIGAEAKEIDAQSFEDLRSILTGSGISRENADKLFVSLANEGITSLDQLATVGEETAVKILAGLQDIGLPFASTTDEIARINKELGEIPGSKQIDIQLNVDAVYGPGTEDILRAAGIDLSKYGNSGDAPGLPPVQSPPPPRGRGGGKGKGKGRSSGGRYYR